MPKMYPNICPNCGRNLGSFYGSIEASGEECFYCQLELREQGNFITKLWFKLRNFVAQKFSKNKNGHTHR
jgi:hypothetical protein